MEEGLTGVCMKVQLNRSGLPEEQSADRVYKAESKFDWNYKGD